MKKLNIDEVMNDKIALEWVTYCLARDVKDPRKWFYEKKEFFNKNQAHLEGLGFSQDRDSIENTLSSAAISYYENLSGSLLVVRVGTDEKPAKPDDLKVVKNWIESALKGIDGVAAIIHSKNIEITQLSLPQLKRLERQSIILMDENSEKEIDQRDIFLDDQLLTTD